MKLNKLCPFLVCFVFTLNSLAQSNNYFYGSFESNGVYYQESESTDYDEKFASNTYLNLKYNLDNKWVFDLQTESYLPKQLQNYSHRLQRQDHLFQYKLQKNQQQDPLL